MPPAVKLVKIGEEENPGSGGGLRKLNDDARLTEVLGVPSMLPLPGPIIAATPAPFRLPPRLPGEQSNPAWGGRWMSEGPVVVKAVPEEPAGLTMTIWCWLVPREGGTVAAEGAWGRGVVAKCKGKAGSGRDGGGGVEPAKHG